MYGGVLGEGSEGEPLLRPFGQGVDLQCACVVLVKSFVVSSASCLLLLLIIMVCWPKALRKKALTSSNASMHREPSWLRWRHASCSTHSELSYGGRCVRRGSAQRISCMCVVCRVRVCVCVCDSSLCTATRAEPRQSLSILFAARASAGPLVNAQGLRIETRRLWRRRRRLNASG